MRAARFLLILLTLAAIFAALAYAFRLPAAGWAVRNAMAAAGLENPSARVTALSFSGARLADVAAGPVATRDFSFETVEADFSLRRLWTEKKADAVRVGPGAVRVRIGDDGKISVAGFGTGGERAGSGAPALPFDRLLLEGVALVVSAPDGDATGALEAQYDIGEGGSGSLTLQTERFQWNDIRLADIKVSVSADLSADGRAAFSADFEGAAKTASVEARNVAATLEGEAGSWRDAAAGATDALSGAARLRFSASEIEIGDATRFEALLSAAQAAFDEDLHAAALSGAFDIAFGDDAAAVRFAEEAPLSLATPSGAALTLTSQGGAPFVAVKEGRQSASFRFSLASERANATGGVDMTRADGTWRVAAPVAVEEFVSDALSLAGSRIELSATSDGRVVDADVTVKSGLRRAQIGRLTVLDAPFSGGFAISGDLAAQRASVAGKSECLAVERAKGIIEEQDLETGFSAMTLCSGQGPLAIVSWDGAPAVSLSGVLSARAASFRLGQTRAQGRPPSIRFDAAYNPTLKTTVVKGAAFDGAMTLNDALDMSGVAGRFDFTLDAEEMNASAQIDRLRIAQKVESGATPLIAPVAAAGEISLSGEKARFAYTLTTPEGRRLGRGEGLHDMQKASGDTAFSFGDLTFAPGGLQPDRIFPALQGIVGAAEGGLDGELRFGWSSGGATSSAQFQLDDISFRGPTLAVTRTAGVSGTVQLTNLLPVATDGLQTITVEAVDMDALQLGQGAVSFELPGDNTVHIAEAEFPWFGGALGVYDATAGFGGEAQVPLRATSVNLAQIFEYVDMDGLSGEGVMSGELPVLFEGGRARIEKGFFTSEGPGVIRYSGQATEAASAAGQDARIAFDILRELRYNSLEVTISGPLDGRLDFQMNFEGTGDVTVRDQDVRVPVIYRISLDAALLELLKQANLSRDIELQIQQGLSQRD